MRVAICGHSSVRDVQSLGNTEFKSTDNSRFIIEYFSIPGSKISDWLKSPKELKNCVSFRPDYIVVVLGGNSIVDSISDSDIKRQYNEFLDLIIEKLPFSKIICTQVELRNIKFAETE